MRILITDGMDKAAMAQLRELGHEVVEQFYEPDQLGAALRDFDAVVVRSKTKVRANHIDEAKGGKLKLIIRGGVGVDNIDVKYAEENGIAVRNTPGASSQSVAELAMGHMFACTRYISIAGHTMREGKWEKKAYGKGIELQGKTLGLVGCGRIGRMLATIAKHGFGMNVIGYDPYLKQEQLGDLITLVENQDEVFKQADFVSLHTPLTPETEHSIGMREFKLMKPTASFINASRGEVVNEAELIQAMQEGVINCAGLDVTEKEPLPLDSPLYSLDNVILTPHTAATTEQSVIRCCETVANDICAVIDGKDAKFAANKF